MLETNHRRLPVSIRYRTDQSLASGLSSLSTFSSHPRSQFFFCGIPEAFRLTTRPGGESFRVSRLYAFLARGWAVLAGGGRILCFGSESLGVVVNSQGLRPNPGWWQKNSRNLRLTSLSNLALTVPLRADRNPPTLDQTTAGSWPASSWPRAQVNDRALFFD